MCKRILDACVVSIACFVAVLLIGGGTAQAQHQFPTADVPTSEPAYLAKVKTAAPTEDGSKASITMMQQGTPRELQAGSNGFTCLVNARRHTAMCRRERFGMDEVDRRSHSAAGHDWLHLHAGRGHRNNQPRSASAGHAPALGADRPARHDCGAQGSKRWWVMPETWTSLILVSRTSCILARPMNI